ncbi:MAG: helix-turn-helix transcriptional regulator [Desulfobacteraceae bacterium]|nr:helix-turn-helix transcriptional regulator [Desulfobacteraceae bacterium]MCP4106825.1 helix-turn-helix transcriptional regulator [Desulfobacteraceae bacterium]
MAIADKIKALRKERKWSQNDLGQAVSVHSKHISRYENDKANPGPEILKKLADAFEVSVDYLIYDNVAKDGKMKIYDPELLEQFEMIADLEEEDRNTIKNVIRAIIIKNQMEKIVKKENKGG